VTQVRIRIADGGAPPYAQLRDAIRARIGSGELLAGDKLPTVRACAQDLGLAPNTVARAYRELEAAGWIVGRGRAGTFVADETPDAGDDRDEQLRTAAQTFLRRAERLGFSRDEARRALDLVPPSS
jgi:DNA-binding transcriptional regulator YhcF (GntR family)